ncbi:MAG: cell wall-binding repeat-containing protein [Coriobacteriia bacterium]|nr:cell wall-binding repeat-containing protein [Coriobacteriia bacterium]
MDGRRSATLRYQGGRGVIALILAVGMLIGLTPGAAYGGWWRYVEPELVSASPTGDPANMRCEDPVISYDGRYVAFESDASNLSPDDQNLSGSGEKDVFVRDRGAEMTYLVSETPSGAVEPDRGSRSPGMSNSGRYIAFLTGRDMLPVDTNDNQDLYVRDMETGEYTLLDALGDGSALGSNISEIAMSGDGQYVVFETDYMLVPDDTNNRSDVYVWSWATDEFVWASETPSSAVVPSRGARSAGISDDGRYIGIFTGRDMVPDDTNDGQDLYVRDMVTGEYTYVDLMGDGSSPGGYLYDFQMTGDGTFIVFTAFDVDIALDDDNGESDVYVWSVADEELIWASETPEGVSEPDRQVFRGTISDDGMRVAFFSDRAYVPDDTNGGRDIYVRDMESGEFERVIVTADGSSPGEGVDGLTLSGDGKWLAFEWGTSLSARVLGSAYYDPADTGVLLPGLKISSGEQVYVINVDTPVEPGATRISGDNRYGTAVAVSEQTFPLGADTVVLATGKSWADVLCASALSGAVNGPLLLTAPDAVPAEVAAEIERLGARYIYIVGGTKAVSGAVEDELYDLVGGYVFRLAGADRYATSRAVAARVIDILGSTYSGMALVTTGSNYPDAIAGAPLAAGLDWPVLLAKTDSVYLPADTTAVMILGGTSAVTPAVQTYAESMLGVDAVERVGGATRYETAAMIAQAGVDAGLRWDGVGIASGTSFPDALAGGSMVGLQRSVMLLTPPDALDAYAEAALDANKAEIEAVRFFGGANALSATVENAVKAILGM